MRKVKMFFEWIICFAFINQLVADIVGRKCLYDGDTEGICLKVSNCDPALRSIKETHFTRLPRCGFMDKSEIVCCPRTGENRGVQAADRECKNIAEQYGPPTDTKIISGTQASEGEFPHMAALAFRVSNSEYKIYCGGSLISDRHILTAAHCINNREMAPPVFVRMGVLDISETRFNKSTDYMIDSIVVHPEYKQPRKYHDLAIIRLTKRVKMSDLVYPVCLYTKDEDPTVPLEITGWGFNQVQRSSTSKVLLKGKISIVPNDICTESYMVTRRLPNGIISKQLCAHDASSKIDACKGDSGGPLQGLTADDGYHRLIGVTSLGYGCATPTPGIYTRVNKYLDWIASVVWPSD